MKDEKTSKPTSDSEVGVDAVVSLRVAKDGAKLFPLIEGESGDEMLEVGYSELPFVAIKHFDPGKEMWFNLDEQTLDELISYLLLLRINWLATKSN